MELTTRDFSLKHYQIKYLSYVIIIMIKFISVRVVFRRDTVAPLPVAATNKMYTAL